MTGRWLSKDPIGIAGGLNQYVAFGDNPVNNVDPFGLHLNLNKKGTKGHEGFEEAGDRGGYFAVGGHGRHFSGQHWGRGILDERGEKGKELDAATLAGIIFNRKDYIKGQPVALESCFLGTGRSGGPKDSFAKALAKALTERLRKDRKNDNVQVDVMAVTGYGEYDENSGDFRPTMKEGDDFPSSWGWYKGGPYPAYRPGSY